MFSELLVIDDPVPRPTALNMAIDEALLASARSAILRFYRWSEPSVSFGYFGKFAEAREFAGGRALVRRWTGGGIVPHGNDLTYSILIAQAESAYGLCSTEIYRRVHEAISSSLRSIGIEAALATGSARKINDACFANAVMADVMQDGQKIAGAAHRKTRIGLLHQGSVQRSDLSGRFRQKLGTMLSSKVIRAEMSPAVIEGAEKLAAEKYATEAWLRRR